MGQKENLLDELQQESMGRFSLEESSEEEGALKKRRYNRGKSVNFYSGDEEEVSDEEGHEEIHETEGGGDGDSKLTFRIDTDVLECSICFEPLHPPIFQCRNGHTACSACCPKLLNKCHVCSRFIGRRRCFSLEKVIESIKVQCQYAKYGCRLTLSLAEKASHEETCSHFPLHCPITDCTFSGSKQSLADHAVHMHHNVLNKFFYDQLFMITLPREKLFMVLLGEDGRIFLLLNNFKSHPGNALSLICIDSNNVKRVFTYELSVRNWGSSLKLRSTAGKVKKWSGVHPTDVFLMIPSDFCTSKLGISINVCIQKSP